MRMGSKALPRGLGGAVEALSFKKLTLGVCCMASKANSQPMQAILRRLEMCGDFIITIFPEDTILNMPEGDWPMVDCLIAFDSSGFPLEKCIRYCTHVNPKCINNVQAQVNLRSRVAVYKTLTEWLIPCPDYVIVDHLNPVGELVENENYIVYNGKKISKPFVEKPEDGDRHDIWIYYPCNIGGGAKKLHRKTKDKSSDFDPDQNKIRKDGVYVYEPFLLTQGTDIKVYTVGAGYVHAEARKAPTVDGKVQRSKDGKEVRYPVVLTQGEKAIAAIIVEAFKQKICGFDILRTDGGSYVCDVNGWSFVKGNQKYYNDCSTLIRKHLLDECGIGGVDTSTMMILGPDDEPILEVGRELTPFDLSPHDVQSQERDLHRRNERLRSIIIIMRHGDRRPKEKMKFKTKQPAILSYFDDWKESTAEVKLKTPEEMGVLKAKIEGVLKELRAQLQAMKQRGAGDSSGNSSPIKDTYTALKQEVVNMDLLIPVLGMQDHFSGFERKVQLKALKWKAAEDGSPRRASQVLVVAKWGGELTVSGLAQAQDLGRRLRQGLYPDDPTGLLRLHSSFRHDFKIYSSQEGRCQITAAAFTKGFLDLEGDIIPILVSLVTRDAYAQGLLDEPIPKQQRDAVKEKIEALLMSLADMSSPEVLPLSCPTEHAGLREAARRIGSPKELLHVIRTLVVEYIESITAAKERAYDEMKLHNKDKEEADDIEDDAHEDAVPLGDKVPNGPCPTPQIPDDLKDSYKQQWLHLRRKEHRWRKLCHGFFQPIDEEKGLTDEANITYDASKIPDVWDNIYYDMLTHRNYLGEESCRIAERLVGLLHPLSEWVSLSEYGISKEEKLKIGVDVTWRLIGKLLGDLEFMIEEKFGNLDEAGRRLTEGGVSREGSSGPPQDQEQANDGPQDADGGPRPGHPERECSQAIPERECSQPSQVGDGNGDSKKIDDSKKKSKLSKLTPQVRNELKQALRDCSDWHPRLNDQVKRLTDIKDTCIVRSRIYVTSASTMHSLFNILRHGHCVSDDEHITKELSSVIDLNYLTHIVLRCYERDEPYAGEVDAQGASQERDVDPATRYERLKNQEKARYRVEILMSPGVQVFNDAGQLVPWPEGRELSQENCMVAPLKLIADSVQLEELDQSLTEAIKEYSAPCASEEDDCDADDNA